MLILFLLMLIAFITYIIWAYHALGRTWEYIPTIPDEDSDIFNTDELRDILMDQIQSYDIQHYDDTDNM